MTTRTKSKGRTTSCDNTEPFREFLDDIATLGVVPVSQGGIRFLVVAARFNARWWLLPIDSPKAAASGLEMLQPVSVGARVVKATMRAILLLRLNVLLSNQVIRLSGLPDLTDTFGSKASHVAYFTGTDGPHRKTAMQVMDASGKILGYGKLSRARHVRPYLRNEVSMLMRVAALGLRTVAVPKVLATRDDDVLTLLVTDSLKSASHTVPLAPQRAHIAFLSEMRARTEQLGAHETLDELRNKASALKETAGPDWIKRLDQVEATLRPRAKDVPVCIAHGDFTPWNCFLQDGRLYVFDWEYAELAWPVGFDLAHFYLATIPAAKQLESVPTLTQALAQEHFGGDVARGRDALLLSLACHAVLYLKRLAETNSPLSDWNDGVHRAAMIDHLLATHTVATP